MLDADRGRLNWGVDMSGTSSSSLPGIYSYSGTNFARLLDVTGDFDVVEGRLRAVAVGSSSSDSMSSCSDCALAFGVLFVRLVFLDLVAFA